MEERTEHTHCMEMAMEDTEGPFTLHLPPSVFDALDNDETHMVTLIPPFEGGIMVHIERDGVFTPYGLGGVR